MSTIRGALRGRSPVVGLLGVAAASLLMMLAPPPSVAAVGGGPPGGSFVAVTPARVVNTRTGLGVAAVGPTRSLVVSVAGHAGVPASGVAAIALNVTVTGGSVPGSVTTYPTGSPVPAAPNVSFLRRQTVSQMVVVPVGAAGRLTLVASAPAHLVVDVEGYFTSPDAARARGLFNPVHPARILDSRTGSGRGTPGPGGVTVMQVTGRGGVPATGVSAVVVNTTITGSASAGYVTEYAAGSPRPATSTVSFSAGRTLANRAIVPVGSGGRINLYNDAGMARLAVDVSGYFTDGHPGATGGYYVPVPVSRLVDTRFWRTSSFMSTRTVKTQKIAGDTCVLSPAVTLCGRVLVPPITAPSRPLAVLVNLTAVPNGVSGYLTAFAAGSPVPASSDLSFTDASAVSNLTFVTLGSRGEVSVRDTSGSANIIEDVCGYFAWPAVSLPAPTLTSGGPGKVPASGGPFFSRPGNPTTPAPRSPGTAAPSAAAPASVPAGGSESPTLQRQVTQPSPAKTPTVSQTPVAPQLVTTPRATASLPPVIAPSGTTQGQTPLSVTQPQVIPPAAARLPSLRSQGQRSFAPRARSASAGRHGSDGRHQNDD